ncbi:hypothetical protein [Microbacterium sp. SORGH_AS_0888]|uniref:hypothetical protein n=1 Tax=Microbacterium sp. SORGH_AS_0888 TaxID=3041791 RepID=UPI0027899A26|nr:hypothetical protein [Microbacterium sp. SORGH_AS_0888]MDQ1130229.1 hypothetical protein [Microbacterium sp. SORGH_AS_0888]
MSAYVTLPILAETGYAVLDAVAPPERSQWQDLEYVGWRSSGITRFAPLTSFDGRIDCNAFWNRTPPRTDKDGVWIDSQVRIAPELARRAQEPGANVGRCRVVELQPNTYADAIYNLHEDDNNRLNTTGSGWVVRCLENLTHDPDSVLVLREDRFDPATETRLPLPAGSRILVDTQRLWHAVWHRGTRPRYALVTSWESGSALDAYVAAHGGRTRTRSLPLDAATIDEAQHELHRRIEERRVALEAAGLSFERPTMSEA